MLIAIDDTGDFADRGDALSCFVATQLRQEPRLLKEKLERFERWEHSIPGALKNHRGEIKGSALSDTQLFQFVVQVIRSSPVVYVSGVGTSPVINPPTVVAKHQHVGWVTIEKAREWYAANDRPKFAQTFLELGHWFKNLSYNQYMKVRVLGECIGRAHVNAYGHSVSGGYDLELPDMRYVIDRDLVKNERHDVYWHEILRHQFREYTKRDPVPHLDTWDETGHPVLDKFGRGPTGNLNVLFWKQLSFARSHLRPELRIADITATIVGRRFNRRGAFAAYNAIGPCFARREPPHLIQLSDFDVNMWRYDDSKHD